MHHEDVVPHVVLHAGPVRTHGALVRLLLRVCPHVAFQALATVASKYELSADGARDEHRRSGQFWTIRRQTDAASRAAGEGKSKVPEAIVGEVPYKVL